MRTEIICILDRSGSMGHLVDDTIGGFNAFIEAQKEVDGECHVTTVLFDNQIETLYTGLDLQEVPEMDHRTYFARGSTSLLDAMGRTINAEGARYARMRKNKRPEKVIVLVITDGYENSSREFTNNQILSMVEHQEGKYGWEFNYLGANQDAFAEAQKWGFKVNNTANYTSSGLGTRAAYGALGSQTASYRKGFTADQVSLTASVAAATAAEEQKISSST